MSTTATPPAVRGLYDIPMWDSIAARQMKLQRCQKCGTVMYPPGPCCTACLSNALDWEPISGNGTILSWIVFHRQYLPAYPAPYNAIAVQLEEGPIMVSNLEGAAPANSWIGQQVTLTYTTMADGMLLPRFRIR